jgi:catechol 2,3-dioxygenase-like lactoylglutathione lyase family enzyme
MAIELDHTIVPSRDKRAAAMQLAELLGVSWSGDQEPFAPVYVNDGFTLDFIATDDDFPVYHFCFRVGSQEFDAILSRIKAAGIEFRSGVHGPIDMQVSTEDGGKRVYWNEPDGHQWEMLTVSYARRAERAGPS